MGLASFTPHDTWNLYGDVGSQANRVGGQIVAWRVNLKPPRPGQRYA